MADNPYTGDAALRNSRYYRIQDGRPVPADPARPAAPDLFASAAIGAFHGFVQNPQFSCVGAKSAVAHDTVRLGVYDRLGSAEASAGLARDLFTFTHEPADLPASDFVTFVAMFREPGDLDEAGFERLLWAELRQLNRLDAPLHDWDPAVSADPDDPHFGFSFAGTAFFVVGLHPHSSRTARRFPWPTLVFNPHAQFTRLKEAGRWSRLQEVIRTREGKLQGSLNPNLADYGTASEARQYSGRPVEPDWQPPFSPRPADASAPRRWLPLRPPARRRRGGEVVTGNVKRLAPQTGTGFLLKKGERLRVIDPLGEQVADFVAFAEDDSREWLSSGRSIDYANTIYLTTGHVLYSNRSRPLLTVESDDVGRHDFLLTPCSADTFRILYGHADPRRGCFGNLAAALAPFGVPPDAIPTTLNLFMNVAIGPTGELTIGPPRSRPGDAVVLRAEADLIVGLTACSAELSNNGTFKPIDYEVLAAG